MVATYRCGTQLFDSLDKPDGRVSMLEGEGTLSASETPVQPYSVIFVVNAVSDNGAKG